MGNNSILITADQLKPETCKDKVSLGFNFTFENHLNLFQKAYYGEISVTSVNGSFTATAPIYKVFDTATGKRLYQGCIECSKKDIQSGIIIRLTDESENPYDNYNKGLNKLIRESGKPLYLRAFDIHNFYNYEKVAELAGISGDLDTLGSITIPQSMLATYPTEDEKRPGARLCFEYDLKSDIPQNGYVSLQYFVTGETTFPYASASLLEGSNDNYNFVELHDDRPKKNGLTVKYGTNTDGTVYHGAILKSVSVYLPVGVTYPAESGYQSVGESAADLSAGKLSVQKTSVQDGKYDARFVKKVNTSELSGKSKAVFSLTNGRKTASVSTDKYYTSLTVDGETISAESGTVFLAYTVKDIPENVNVTAANIILE